MSDNGELAGSNICAQLLFGSSDRDLIGGDGCFGGFNDTHERLFIEAVCAFLGITPPPQVAGRARSAS